MKVDKSSGTSKTGFTKKTRKSDSASGAGFADALRSSDSTEEADGTSESSSVGGASGVNSIDALLAVQGVDDATEDKPKRQKPKEWGSSLLDRLDDIRVALLAGRLPPERLEKLREAIERERENTEDPDLAAVLREVEIRARVELAKYRQG